MLFGSSRLECALYVVHNFCLTDDNLLLGSPLGSQYVYTAVSTKVVQKSVKAYVIMPRGSLGNTQ